MVELWVLHIVSLRPTYDRSLKKILPGDRGYGADMKFKAQTHDLDLWSWPWVGMVDLWVLHIVSLRQTYDQSLKKILPGVQEIWSGHEIQGSNPWPWPVTYTLSWHGWLMGSAHRITEANIYQKLNENLSKGSGDMERTGKCYGRTDGRTDGQTKAISIIPHPLHGWGLISQSIYNRSKSFLTFVWRIDQT